MTRTRFTPGSLPTVLRARAGVRHPVNRTRNFHNFSLETPEFFDDLFLRLTADTSPPPNRLIYRVQTPDGAVYWVLTRGR